MAEPRWLAEARRYIGQREIAGTKHNPLILKWWTAIRAPFTDDETPWCAAFVGAMLEACGIRSTRSAWARSYEKYGQRLEKPVVGCIAVFTRGKSNGHVAFYIGRDARGNILVLGGNQSDRVSIAAYPAARLLGFRWPAGVALPGSSEPVTKPVPPKPPAPKPAPPPEPAEPAPPIVPPPPPAPAEKDEEEDEDEKPKKKGPFRRALEWLGGSGAAGFLAYLTDWRVILALGVVSIAGVLVWHFLIRKRRKRR